MNCWTEKSMHLAKTTNYLDELFNVYNVELDFSPRLINETNLNEIRNYYKNKDYYSLVKILLNFEKFPIDYSYVGFLKLFNNGVLLNPKTTERIGRYLTENFEYEDIVSLLKLPKQSSRKIDSMFHTWISKGSLGPKYKIFKKADNLDFFNSDFGILCCGAAALKRFCAENFGYIRDDKGIDFVCKVKNKYVIGEAKFISNTGGTQDKSFKDIKSLISPSSWTQCNREIIPIGILDGTPFVQGGHYEEDLNHDDWNIMSVLVLRDFLESLE